MIKHGLFVWLCYTLLFNLSWAAPASHPNFQTVRGELELKATATATWLVFIDVYDAALYTEPEGQANLLLEGEQPFSLELRYKVPLSKSQLIEGADVALGRQHTQQQQALYKKDVDALHYYYQDVSEGDRFRLDIHPEEGLSLLFNDALLYKNANIDFALYYVGLWLAENPLSKPVRQGLLGW